MAKKQKKAKMNPRLLNAKMDKKFKKSFMYVNVGFLITTGIAIVNVVLLNMELIKRDATSSIAFIGIGVLLAVVILNMIMNKTIAKSLTTAIVEPVSELQTAVEKLKLGEFDIEITYNSEDEIGELARNLKETCAQMHAIISDADYLLDEMAEGRFDVASKMPEGYVGDFKSLIESIEKLNDQLDMTLHQIKDASGQVMSGSEQLANSAHELAEGATEQAGAIEELTATIEDVTNISEESAKNAVTAAKSAKKAAEEAEQSRGEIAQLTKAMEGITDTSREIEKIITAIEDIASQTNLLSLNASIEAARAGEAGRGFAVVADQIGKLATDSAQSAVTTRELISKSLDEIEVGNKIVENTIESFGAVLANMEAFAGMASESAKASRTQADMLGQIEEGIEQISSVVQNNSAAAQETSAISEELSAQAVSLEEMVAQFELR